MLRRPPRAAVPGREDRLGALGLARISPLKHADLPGCQVSEALQVEIFSASKPE
ncbi:hypothetical protein [Streptomyces goshikiensis]|uniref:hypothetical protein n=1 Tax=Streptomyces goshikiensis TaxID=1942 RepID=UPI0037126848